MSTIKRFKGSNITVITIIIPTCWVPKYLDECIESIPRGDGIEIMIGIDGCALTKEHVIGNETYDGIKVFYFPGVANLHYPGSTNLGPYIIKNNLLSLAGEKVLFFDSDDVMCERMVQECFNWLNRRNMVRFRYQAFGEGQQTNIAAGVFGINRSACGLFQNWLCGADSDFNLRHRHVFKHIIQETMFLRRVHDLNLTVHETTNFQSQLRRSYAELIGKSIPEPLIVNYERIQ